MPLKEIRQAAPQPSPVEPTPPRPPEGFSPHVPVIPPRSGHPLPIPTPFPKEIDYPSYDGLPMADNTDQAEEMTDDFQTLVTHFGDDDDVFVATNLLVYYREDDNETRITPDVMVALGRPKGYRGSYKIWEEGHHPPDWVLEIASEGTVKVDVEEKPGTYAGIGVREYWQYDPSGGLLSPRLQGRRLSGLGYEELPRVPVAGAQIAIYSEVLGLRLEFDGKRLRFWDPVGERYLLKPQEEARARRKAEQRQREDAQARRKAEQAQRKAEQRQREDAQARRKAEQARREAEQAQRKAEQAQREEAQARREAERRQREEAQARREAERRVQELRELLASQRTGAQPPGSAED